MKHIKVEKALAADWPEASNFFAGLAARNNIDTGVFSYPATETLKASNGKSLVYLPIQPTYFLEALGINPEATPMEVAAALKALFQVIEWEAVNKGMGEIYFLCADEETKNFAEHQGMKKIETLTLYRRKL